MFTQAQQPQAASSQTAQAQASAPIGGVRAAPSNTDALDNLTSGMKKITLKHSTTREEHEKKQKEREAVGAAERRARALKGAETRRVNAAAKKEKAARESEVAAQQARAGAQIPSTTESAQPVAASAPPIEVDAVPMASGDGQAATLNTEPALVQPHAGQMDVVMGTPAAQRSTIGDGDQPSANDTSATDGVTVSEMSPPASIQPAASSPTAMQPITSPFEAPPRMPEVRRSSYRYVDNRPSKTPPSAFASASPPEPAIQEAESPSQPLTTVGPEDTIGPLSAPGPEPLTAKKAAPQPVVPDSAARQLVQEAGIAAGVEAGLPTFGTTTMPHSPTNGGRTQLPVWSSTGPIPFAPAQGVSKAETSAGIGAGAEDMHLSGQAGIQGVDDAGLMQPEGSERGNAEALAQAGKPTKQDGHSIWEAPETPQR